MFRQQILNSEHKQISKINSPKSKNLISEKVYINLIAEIVKKLDTNLISELKLGENNTEITQI